MAQWIAAITMFIFARLLLAHLIGDFVLQSNKILAMKRKGIFGVGVHVLIIFFCFVILSWPYLNNINLWLFIVFVCVTHLIQDHWKIQDDKKNGQSPWKYLLDQAVHIAILAIVFLTNLKNIAPVPQDGAILASLYNNTTLVLYLGALIFAVLGGFYLIISIYQDLFKKEKHYKNTEKWAGFIERAGIVTFFFFGPKNLIVLCLLLLWRPIAHKILKEKLSLDHHAPDFKEFLFSWIIALSCGYVFSHPV